MGAPEDDTPAALAAIRGLAAEREADEIAERETRPDPPPAQAARAIAILESQRRWTIEDRRALGLTRSADEGDWSATVRRRMDELDGVVVFEAWLTAVEADAGWRSMDAAVAALLRSGGISASAPRVRRLLCEAPSSSRQRICDALIAATGDAGMPIDRPLLQLVRSILVDPETAREPASSVVMLAGALARRAPAAAAILAERIRADRVQQRADANSPLPLEQRVAAARAVSSSTHVAAVTRSGCPALAPIALLELEDCTYEHDLERWARALLAVAGEAGAAYLARMRDRPGWSALLGEAPVLPAAPLLGLLSPIADVRRRSLEALAASPRPEHLQALLLAAELDRHVTRKVLRRSWRQIEPGRWPPWMFPLARSTPGLSADFVRSYEHLYHRLPRDIGGFFGALLDTNARFLLEDLIDAGAPRAAMPTPQQLTPELVELAEVGVEAYATRLLVTGLTAEERAAIEQEEAELAASAAHLVAL